jgi:hypothetical protein
MTMMEITVTIMGPENKSQPQYLGKRFPRTMQITRKAVKDIPIAISGCRIRFKLSNTSLREVYLQINKDKIDVRNIRANSLR